MPGMSLQRIATVEVFRRLRRVDLPLLGPVCALVLLLFVYGPVLFQGEQFAFRDAAHFYYPLYLRVQQEWQAGRWPLWDPGQNGGQPLLGSPMAAVLYPGKLAFAILPYAWGVRLYVLGHTALAFAGMLALARSLGISRAGAGLAGLSYAFGAPVLFQYGNVIYLVGAAWFPWGLRAIGKLEDSGRPWGIPGLAVVLAMQVLGGDPQSAYLTVLCGAGYAWLRAVPDRPPLPIVARRLVLVPALVVAWVVVVLALACWRPPIPGRVVGVWWPALAAWLAAVVWFAWRRLPAGGLGARLAVAAFLALVLSSAQVFPVVEFLAMGSRTGERMPTLRTRFSVEPYRLVESVWPWAFGHPFPENRTWVQVIPPEGDRELWEPSLYVGGLALMLAIGAARFRGGPPWRAWLTSVALLALVLSLGKFGGPLWWARWIPGLESVLGPHDPPHGASRADACFLDGAGSPYDLLSAMLPGFGLFRYPAKLLTPWAAAVAVLAGLGWDEVVAGRSKRFTRACLVALATGAAALSAATALRGRAVGFLSAYAPIQGDLGPVDAAAAWTETQRALAHGTFIYAMGLALAAWGPRRPAWAGALALVALAVDLGLTVGNGRLIWTAPQSDFDAVPEAARRIADAELADPSPGPFRIHRMTAWHPARFLDPGSPARARELFAWDRATLTPLDALPVGLEYCWTKGVIELDDYFTFFVPRIIPARAEASRVLKVPLDHPVYYYPRRSYDLWGARYFILPVRTSRWKTEERGFSAFLPDTEVVHPRREEGTETAGPGSWAMRQDWQILRNKAAYPRAWLVHHARIRPPASDPVARADLVAEIAHPGDLFWSEPGWPVHDPRSSAWIETEDREALRGYLSRGAVEPGESVAVTGSDPQRVELKARLNRSGIVILADTFYPGWHLTIDGRPAPILRANRMMRGAAVSPGAHTLVYVYDPWSFRVGLALSLLGLAAMPALAMVMSIVVRRSPSSRTDGDGVVPAVPS